MTKLRFTIALGVLHSFLAVSMLTAEADPIQPFAPNYAWAFDDGPGATEASAEFGSVDGQISGAVDSTSTAFGYAGNRSLEFDGIDDLVTLESINLSGGGNNTFSISAWVYSRDVAGENEGVIFGNWFQGDDHQSVMLQEMDNNRTRLIVRQFNDAAGAVGPIAMPKGEWVHLAVVWDGAAVGGSSSLYLNGDLLATSGANLLRNLADEGTYGIGGDSGVAATARYFDGFIDEVAVWRSALNADEVEWLTQNSVTTVSPSMFALQVNTITGHVQLYAGRSIDINGYRISSESGSLDPTGWTSLEDNPEYGDGIHGNGVGWETLNSASGELAEAVLLGSTVFALGDSVALGEVFGGPEIHDLQLEISLEDGHLIRGEVRYLRSGDYNDDGVVDAADYTVWRDNFGASLTLNGENPTATTPGVVDLEDYDYWKAQFGATSAADNLHASSAVPEPSMAVLTLLGLGAAIAPRCR